MTERSRLGGRRILITGAASGIGAATAEAFLAAGAQVALIDRDWSRVSAREPAAGEHRYTADVSDDAAVADTVRAAAAAMGGIDGVVNAAGVLLSAPVADISPADFRRVLDVNLVGAYSVIHFALPFLEEAETATVVNVSSGAGLRPGPNRSAYASSKGGLVNLTRTLAAELAPGVRVNTVCPGLIDTPMAVQAGGDPANYALQRLGEPWEIADAILYLTSPQSSYVTGAALAVDGGRTFH